MNRAGYNLRIDRRVERQDYRSLPMGGATVKQLVIGILFDRMQPRLRCRRPAAGATRNVVLIVGDGIRWQEVFTGADPTLMNENEGGSWIPTEVLKKRFWRDDASERRKALMPFMWGTVASQGQIFGNGPKGSVARVSNGLAFSYPGYNEMITGAPDAKIDSNEFGPNPHVSVFEWLAGLPEYRDRVAVFGSWETFNDIFNERRSGLPVFSGPAILQSRARSPRGANCSSGCTVPRRASMPTTRTIPSCRSPCSITCRSTSRARSSSATASRTAGRIPGGTTSWCRAFKTSTISSASCGRRCSRCPRTAIRPLSSSPRTTGAAAG